MQRSTGMPHLYLLNFRQKRNTPKNSVQNSFAICMAPDSQLMAGRRSIAHNLSNWDLSRGSATPMFSGILRGASYAVFMVTTSPHLDLPTVSIGLKVK